MYIISHKSADLKSLADGFEVVTNQRREKRTVLTPPLQAKDNFGNDVYIFDKSLHGVSFYYKDKDHTSLLDENEIITLTYNDPSTNQEVQQTYTIRYKGDHIIKNVYFYGAHIV
jgi:hypothetical protein